MKWAPNWIHWRVSICPRGCGVLHSGQTHSNCIILAITWRWRKRKLLTQYDTIRNWIRSIWIPDQASSFAQFYTAISSLLFTTQARYFEWIFTRARCKQSKCRSTLTERWPLPARPCPGSGPGTKRSEYLEACKHYTPPNWHKWHSRMPLLWSYLCHCTFDIWIIQTHFLCLTSQSLSTEAVLAAVACCIYLFIYLCHLLGAAFHNTPTYIPWI